MPIALPLKIRPVAEAYRIDDAQKRPVAYVYFDEDEARRNISRRLKKDEAREVARRIARALSAER